MATCKDCVHFDVCCSYLSTAYNKCKLGTPDFKLLKNIECDECQHFKDRSRFVELPCKVGDTVYHLECGTINEHRVNGIRYHDDAFFNGWVITSPGVKFTATMIGKTVFLKREEAEQALKLKERENNA